MKIISPNYDGLLFKPSFSPKYFNKKACTSCTAVSICVTKENSSWDQIFLTKCLQQELSVSVPMKLFVFPLIYIYFLPLKTWCFSDTGASKMFTDTEQLVYPSSSSGNPVAVLSACMRGVFTCMNQHLSNPTVCYCHLWC